MKVFENLAETLASRDRAFTEMMQQHNKAFKWAWAGSLSAAVVALVIAIIAMAR